MRIRSLNSVLDDCLAAMRSGESVEACLARYPRHAARLRPLLQLAERVYAAPAARPRHWAEARTWELVRGRGRELREGRRRRRRPSISYGAWLRPLAVGLVLVLSLFAAGGGAALAAQDTLPDHPLYRVKLATEDVRLWFVFDETREAQILLDQSNKRMEEMLTLVQQGEPIPANVLSALKNRNERAAAILAERPHETELRARILSQAELQQQLLVALWPDVAEPAQDEYSVAVAFIHNTRLQGGGEAVAVISPEDLSGGVLDISGVVEPAGEGLWRIGGVEVRVDQRTIGYRELQEGAPARFVVARSSNGRLQALSLSTLRTDMSSSGSVVYGAVDEITSEGIRVAGQLYPFTPETLFRLKLRQGQRVELTLGNTAGGVAVTTVNPVSAPAELAERASLTYEGTIEGDISRTNQWTIGGLNFLVTSATSVDAKAGRAESGARVQVEAVNQDGQLQARQLTVLASDAPPGSAYLVGTFQGMRDGYWVVSGLQLVAPEGMETPAEGATLATDITLSDGELEALTSTVTEGPGRSDMIRFKGTVLDIQDSTWTLEIGQVKVTSKAQVAGKPVVGGRVLGWAQISREGVQEAVYVRALDQRPVTEPATPPATPAPQ